MKNEAVDFLPAEATAADRQALLIAQQAAAEAAEQRGLQQGKGRKVIAAMIEQAKREQRDIAHDRFHLRKVNEQIVIRAGLAQEIPAEVSDEELAGVVAEVQAQKKARRAGGAA